ncbi:hypothetical protein DL546_002420 [Coniochaeta pulveracea]|uniref:Uncharacterized protein n=1 Tax=Coniochaeta pulveracea TaxID=177199 RepID=A0A420XXX2_9PEZI|nr:hypothetical protein DL546_002420 [Coniochaeta pulveracea]
MSRNNSASSFHHQESLFTFSVFQPVLGSALQWFPALGSRELDNLINAFVPGPSSIQDKRAHVAMDFYEYAAQTGDNFKMYSVYGSVASGPCATDSPASSSGMYDSGYGSTFNVSPVVADTGFYTPYLPAVTPSSTTSASSGSSSCAAKKAAPSAPRSDSRLDFLNHPGMRILTKDGRDVTNSAGRGSKTKEQRDHAHLMRVIKACDACRRKKTRCDPSHKKRTTSSSRSQPQSQQPAESSVRSAKKARTVKRTAAHEPQVHALATTAHSLLDNDALLDAPAVSYEQLSETPDDFWLQYVNFEGAAPFPEEYNLANPFGSFSSHSASETASPLQPLVPFPSVSANSVDLPAVTSQEPRLPYLQPDGPFGTDYVDFSLYSPTSDFSGEEAEFSNRSLPRTTGHPQRQPGITHEPRLPERGLPLFSDRQSQLLTAQVGPGGSDPQSASSTWSSADVGANALQHAASSICSSTLRPNRRNAGTQDSPVQSQPSPSSDGLGAATSLSTLHNNRCLPPLAQDAIVSPTLPPDRQAISLQQTTSSSHHDVPGALLTTVKLGLWEYAVLAATHSLDEAKAGGTSHSKALTAGSRHIPGVPRTRLSSSQATSPESLADLGISSFTGRGANLEPLEHAQTTSEALLAINAQFPAHVDEETDAAGPVSGLSSESVAANGYDRPRPVDRTQEPVVPTRNQSTVLNSYAGSRTERLRSSPSQGKSSTSKAETATAESFRGGCVVDVLPSSDGFKRGYTAAFGLIAGALVSAALRLTSWTATLHVLLLFFGLYHHSADLDGVHRQEFHRDIVLGRRIDRQGHCRTPMVPLASRLHKLSRHVEGLRCAVVQ